MCKKVWRAIKLDYSSFFYSIAGCSATIIAIIGGFIASKLISSKALDPSNIIVVKSKTHDAIHKAEANSPETLKELAKEKGWNEENIK